MTFKWLFILTKNFNRGVDYYGTMGSCNLNSWYLLCFRVQNLQVEEGEVNQVDITQVPLDLWISQGVFCLLFLWLFWDTRKESKQREQMYMDRELRLSEQLDKQNIAQEKIVVSLQALEHQMTNLKGEGK